MEKVLALNKEGYIFSKLLIRIKKCIERFSECTRYLNYCQNEEFGTRWGLYTWRQNFMGPQTKHSTSEALRNTSMTCPYWPIASKNRLVLARFIISLRCPWTSWIFSIARRTSSIDENRKLLISSLVKRLEKLATACLNCSLMTAISPELRDRNWHRQNESHEATE